MIVVGMGFGDEGKGLTTSYLCSKTESPLVVRFNGGHQAGHTVVYNGKRHVFSGLGSGTLQGVPTYWSKYCTFYPNSFMREYEMLKVFRPNIIVDPLCPVTSPFDIIHNRETEKIKKHGSVGMGFGATLQRQENYFKLHVQDLMYEDIVVQKLKAIAGYYGSFNKDEINSNISYFLGAVDKVRKVIRIDTDSVLKEYNPIFEGGQGILLDMDFGFFPHVTRSNTTTKNALELYPQSSDVYYVTRSYLTRHGNGYLPKECELPLIHNEEETNKSHEYQGEFRTAKLNPDLMNYALDCDNNFSRGMNKNLVITCIDQYPINVDALLSQLNIDFDNVYVSTGPSLTNIYKR